MKLPRNIRNILRNRLSTRIIKSSNYSKRRDHISDYQVDLYKGDITSMVGEPKCNPKFKSNEEE